MGNLIQVKAGDRYGRLTVIDEENRETAFRGRRLRRFTCKCDCGKVVSVRLCNLRSGGTASCGCLRSPTRSGRPTQRLQYPREYEAWGSMIKRCTNPNTNTYSNYGGRGIKVCERWMKSFEAFLDDMGPRPSDKHSIDRFPDNDGDYEPGNCRWATRREQTRNKRNNHLLTFKGETMCLAAWTERLGMKKDALRYRLESGWSAEDALTKPIQSRNVRGSNHGNSEPA